jgi:hypothetical protein
MHLSIYILLHSSSSTTIASKFIMPICSVQCTLRKLPAFGNTGTRARQKEAEEAMEKKV